MISNACGPKSRKHSKTFTGCWTCRARKVKCDEKRPECMQCVSKKLECAGYGLRLHWLPPEQGMAISRQDARDLSHVRSQRSQIPFEPNHHALNDDQLDGILASIDELEPPNVFDSSTDPETLIIHNFGVFDLCPSRADPPDGFDHSIDQEFPSRATCYDSPSFLSDQSSSAIHPNHTDATFPFATDFLESLDAPGHTVVDKRAVRNTAIFPGSAPDWDRQKLDQTSCDIQDHNDSQRNMPRVNSQLFRWHEPNGSIMFNPSPTYLSPLEQFLIHHYMSRAIRLFCVIDNKKSPWHRIHLKRTLQGTGQMNIQGSTSNIQNALRNALLSISAFTLSNDSRSRGYQEESTKWTNEAMIFRGQTFRLLKDSVEHGFEYEPSPKYKDYLATMLSMISINVMSGDTSTCGVHLDGAFHFMKSARNWKSNYSPKARSLHQIYFYLRTIYESTAMRNQTQGSFQSSKVMIPELFETGATGQVDRLSRSLSGHSHEPWAEINFVSIYGVPQHLLVLLGKTTELTVSLTKAREAGENSKVPSELSAECDDLERAIMDWSLDQELDRYLAGDVDSSLNIIRQTSRAFHNALIIYFAQHVRLVGYRYLRSHIEVVLDCIEAIEKIKEESNCFAAPLYWPAFIAASEAFDEQFQNRFRAWYERVELYGIAAVRTGIMVLAQVWKNGPDVLNQTTSHWRMEVKRSSSILMLS
ncbi:fungal-specific transcription factor domain-containing protein [Aspergillus caelatus]|uniref:Fungal-specific transcription factor domain-containing protein n=2 Tax=Aspergillus subgen. Circumdati TaxID=2720871 RepID=A0A5N7AKJ0_9EURO|nr:fungal-specific transcription factor domain-containing protein [Aspergillus caelatus]KAE8370444.1 fungal-specific transcription factor domain-containing protein [Aspergillus caelatus]KAE8415601.1 fungal-specific transcription factor domain-containing protein [Aspergillus pseudocaelatus]